MHFFCTLSVNICIFVHVIWLDNYIPKLGEVQLCFSLHIGLKNVDWVVSHENRNKIEFVPQCYVGQKPSVVIRGVQRCLFHPSVSCSIILESLQQMLQQMLLPLEMSGEHLPVFHPLMVFIITPQRLRTTTGWKSAHTKLEISGSPFPRPRIVINMYKFILIIGSISRRRCSVSRGEQAR